MTTRCCRETGCTRKKPFKIRRGAFSGRIYLMTDYSDDGRTLEAKRRHDITEEAEAFMRSEQPLRMPDTRPTKELLAELSLLCARHIDKFGDLRPMEIEALLRGRGQP